MDYNKDMEKEKMNEDMLKNYATTKEKYKKIDEEYKKELAPIKEQIAKLQQESVDLFNNKYRELIDPLKISLSNDKSTIENEWDSEETSIKVDEIGRFTLKKLPKVNVFDKAELLKDLTKKDMLNNAVTGFNNKFLQSMLEAGMMLPGAKIDKSNSLSFTPVKK